MTNEQSEKEWLELVEKASEKQLDSANMYPESRYGIPGKFCIYDFKAGAQFVRANLSSLPEVRELIEEIKNVDNVCECDDDTYSFIEKVKVIVKNLEGEK